MKKLIGNEAGHLPGFFHFQEESNGQGDFLGKTGVYRQ